MGTKQIFKVNFKRKKQIDLNELKKLYFIGYTSTPFIKIIVLMKGNFNEKSCIIAPAKSNIVLIYYSMYYHDHIQF